MIGGEQKWKNMTKYEVTSQNKYEIMKNRSWFRLCEVGWWVWADYRWGWWQKRVCLRSASDGQKMHKYEKMSGDKSK